MDFEKLRKDAQNQLDQKLAEVARLTETAKELKKKNAEAQAEHDKLVDTLQGNIDSLRADKAFAEEEVSKVKESLAVKQDELYIAQRSIDEVNIEYDDITDLIEEEKRELAVVEQTGEKTVKAIKAKVAEKQAELKDIQTKVDIKVAATNNELASLSKEVEKARKELAETEKDIEANKVESVRFQNISKEAMRDAESAEHRAVLAREEVEKAEKRLATLTEETNTAKTALASLKAEIEEVEAELKPLLAKRIDSVNYMKELEYKEANLRKKYEDVGLNYE